MAVLTRVRRLLGWGFHYSGLVMGLPRNPTGTRSVCRDKPHPSHDFSA